MKKVICIIGCLCFFAGLIVIIISIYKNKETEDDSSSKYRDEGWGIGEYEAYALREKYPTDILWIGPWEGYEWEISIRFAESVNRETLTMRDGFQHMYIVVNDLDGSVTLTEEEYRLINSYVKADFRYHFLYLGRERLAEICDYGFGDKGGITPVDYSIGMFHRGEHLVSVWGVYSQTNIDYESNLCECVLNGLELSLPQE